MTDREIHQPILSLCIPTNGKAEWILPTLESIYTQGVEETEFEVVVTDNGKDSALARGMEKLLREHGNLIYQRNDSEMFYNQLEALKPAHGMFLKFVNHRGIMEPGGLRRMIEIVLENRDRKPPIYMSNGFLKKDRIDCASFDEYVREIGIYASWTTGVGIWKEEFDRIRDHLVADRISPHSCVLFSRRKDDYYRIYNDKLSSELTHDHKNKGTYDLFKAFGVEELFITHRLYIDGDITAETFKKVKKDYRRFTSFLYFDFMIRKKPCSYDLSGFNDAMGIYFRKTEVIAGAFAQIPKRIISKITKEPII